MAHPRDCADHYNTLGYWVEVDDPNDLAVARFSFQPRDRGGILDRSWGGHWSFNLLDFSLPRNAYFPPAAMPQSP